MEPLVSWTTMGAMALAALVMVLTPGPNMIYLISRAVAQGPRAGLISLAGTGAGFLVYLSAANLGLVMVFVLVPWLYIGLKAVGVAYLLFLAWSALRPGGAGLFEQQALTSDPPSRLFRTGLITNLLNPKVAVMYLALIPQFIDPRAGSPMAQGFLLGGVQILVSLAVNAAIVLAAGSIARFLTARPAWTRWQRRITGGLLGVVALLLAREVPQAAKV
ncbi:MAG: LysE family translocator [Microbacterium sp.]|jgi:threonine/homoserine/homoserine lactone efflux protein|nr:LysE family translocator [Microbacterium sp.]